MLHRFFTSCCGRDGQLEAETACWSPGMAAASTPRQAGIVPLCTQAESLLGIQLVRFWTRYADHALIEPLHATEIRVAGCGRVSADLSAPDGAADTPCEKSRCTPLIREMPASMSERQQ